MSLEPPFLLVDRYDVTEQIGRGGHAVVYRATDRVLGREVAVKLLREDALSADTLARFRQEVQVTAQLEHAHILHVYDTGTFEGRPYIVMELAPGRTLADRLEREGQLPIVDALQIARDVGLALAHAHAQGVVHRDVKPENILLGTGGAILADFGIARVTTDDITRQLTSTGIAVGTVQYMSPEQLCAEKHIDARSDQYSLACVLYEMIAGVRPHIAATPEGLRLLRMTDRHVPVSAHRPAVAEHVNEALQVALHSMSADRFRSVDDFLAALGLSASGEYAASASASGSHPSSEAGRSGKSASVSGTGHEPPANGARATRSRRIALACTGVAVAAGLVYVGKDIALATSTRLDGSKGALVNTLDVTLAPMTDTSAGATRVRDALRAELVAWPAVRMADGRSRAGVSLEFSPSLEALGDSSRLVLRVVDVTSRESSSAASRYETIVSTARLDSAAAVASDVAALIRQALAGVPASAAPGVEFLPDRSLGALHAYVNGFALLRKGTLADASRQFRAARDSSPRFALAAFWAAQTGAWAAPNDVASWRGDIEAAVRVNALRGTDSLLAAGLQHHAAMAFVPACDAYRAATQRDEASFTAWYGLGTCLRLDSAVVRSAAGLRFRSSHWEALKAYQRAVDLAPTSEWLAALFAPVLRMTYSMGSQVRSGYDVSDRRNQFFALPGTSGDSLEFEPVSRAEFEMAGSGRVPLTWAAALRRGRKTALDIVGAWIARASNSPDAWFMRAVTLEQAGRLEGNDAFTSASAALTRAAEHSPSPSLTTQIAVAGSRIALRRGDLSAAVGLAEAAIRNAADVHVENRTRLAPLAALIGDVEGTATLSSFNAGDFPDLPVAVAQALHRFQLAVAQGECVELASAQRSLDGLAKSSSAPDEIEQRRARWLRPAYLAATPCIGPSALAAFTPKGDIELAIDALGRNEFSQAIQFINSAQTKRRGVNVAAMSWDYLFLESWVLAAAGDTVSARNQLQSALTDIASMSSSTLDFVPQAAGLRRGVLLLDSLSGPVTSPARASTVGKMLAQWAKDLQRNRAKETTK